MSEKPYHARVFDAALAMRGVTVPVAVERWNNERPNKLTRGMVHAWRSSVNPTLGSLRMLADLAGVSVHELIEP